MFDKFEKAGTGKSPRSVQKHLEHLGKLALQVHHQLAAALLCGSLDRIQMLLGVVSGRSCWGLEPWDLNPSRSKANKPDVEARDIESRESRAKPHSTDGLRELVEDLENKAKKQEEAEAQAKRAACIAQIWHPPLRRHVWGEQQYELHASWGEESPAVL